MNSLKQLNEAMAYIEARLTEPINFEEVGKKAGCSGYHFKRMFSFLAGMSIGEYVRNRRLSLAVNYLMNTDQKIIDIALLLGYESPDAFTKAFSALHGVSPSKARAERLNLKVFTPMTFSLQIQGGTQMVYRLVEKEAFYVVGYKKRTELIYEGIGTEMQVLATELGIEKLLRLKALSNLEPMGILSVTDNIDSERLLGSELDQYIGVVRTEVASLDPKEGYDLLEVGAGKWAVFTVVGKFPEAVQQTWASIFSEWFASSDYELREGPEMLWYEGQDMTRPDFKCELWIPVSQKVG